MTLNDFGSIASIISLFIGGGLGYLVCTKTSTVFKNVSASGDVVGRDKTGRDKTEN